MKFECPSCKKPGLVDDSKVPQDGVFATCPECNNKFLIMREKPKDFEFEPVGQDKSELNDTHVKNPTKIQNLNAQSSSKGKPWRRYWARTIDTMLLALPIGFLFGVFFPQFTFNTMKSGGELIVGIFILPFIMLGEACILGTIGTTFGKWLLNITLVHKKDGGSLTYSEALKRSILIWIKGLAFGLPLISMITMAFSASQIRKHGNASWDNSISTDVRCESLQAWRVCLAVLSIISLILIYGMLENHSSTKSSHSPVTASNTGAPAPMPDPNIQARPPVLLPESVVPPTNIYPLEPFIVNIYDNQKLCYLKIKVELEMINPTIKAELNPRLPLIRDDILILLNNKTFQNIQDKFGKIQLKNEILAAVNKHLSPGKIVNVYFTDFVVQDVN